MCAETKPINKRPRPGIGEETVTYRPLQKFLNRFRGKIPQFKGWGG